MSRSSTITFLLEYTMMPTKFMAMNVFPSPDMVDEIEITFASSELASESRNCKLLRKLLNDSDIIDLGLLSISNCKVGMSLLYLGIIPKIDIDALVSLVISFNEVMLL